MKPKLLAYYTQHLQVLTETSKAVIRTLDTEAIHDMRLSIKRLRVFFGFLAPLEEDTIHSTAFLSKAAKVFRHAGRLRDLQIQQENIRRIELKTGMPYPEYQAYLHEKMQLHQTRLIHRLDRSNMLTKAPQRAIIEAALEKHISKDINIKFREHMDHLYEEFVNHCLLWEKDRKASHLHRARRFLKNIYYLLNMAELSRARINKRVHSAHTIKSVEQDLGKWHDLDVGLIQLKVFLLEHQLPEHRMSRYEKLNQALEKEMNQALKRAYKAAGHVLAEERKKRPQ